MSIKNRFYSYLNSTEEILAKYDGKEPFSIAIRKFFKAHKKYGSRDRRTISHLCYCYFRLGKWKTNMPVQERILIALFLCSNNEETTGNAIIEAIKPEWAGKIGLTTREKIDFINIDENEIFPWGGKLDKNINLKEFTHSFFTQPDLFLRIRPNRSEEVLKKLENAKIDYEKCSDNCVNVPNRTKIDQIFTADKEVVIQDYSSQKIIELFRKADLPDKATIWDCCAGSGGKSLLIFDENPHIELTVSDIRHNILGNLKKRFKTAGVDNYNSEVIDLTAPQTKINDQQFDLILADVPCTGSGTWGRTPEQLFYFDEEKISYYANIQRAILNQIITKIKPGGYLLYATCSVFRAENEAQIEQILRKHNLELIHSKLFIGYHKKADTLYGALLKKNS